MRYGIIECNTVEGSVTMRKFMIGTDWWTDCDDAVAMRLVCRAALDGEIRLEGVCLNACMEHSVASLDGFLAQEGMGDVPIGIDRAGTDFAGIPRYQKGLIGYTRRMHSNTEAEDGVRLYRRILAQADGKVEIIEIGFLQVIANLLESGADEFSEKTGLELVEDKVEKFWVMAGKWDEQGGREHNFTNNARSRKAGEVFCRLCPVPVTFLGWEIGNTVITGRSLAHDDVLYRLMCDHGSPNGRMSWDPMLALMALVGSEEKAGYGVVRGQARVDAETGANYFTQNDAGKQAYVVKKWEDARYAQLIDALVKSKA